MSQITQLPPDQRAVVSLVLRQGKSHAEVAEMLGIPEDAVRDRASAALDTLDAAPQAGSRTTGALLLVALVALVVVAVLLITGAGGKGSSNSPSAAPNSTSTTATGSANQAKVDKTIALTSPDPSVKAAGAADVLSDAGKRAFYVAAQGLQPSSGFFYAVWLYNSPSSSLPLGRAPTVGSNGRMAGGGPLPSNAGIYHHLIVTRETNEHPSQPGPIVLTGAFALH